MGSRRSLFTRTFKISLALVFFGVVFVANAPGGDHKEGHPLFAVGVLFLCLGGPVFLVSGTRHLLRGLLWRVGSRLFVSYVLIGVVPLIFIFGFLLLVTFMIAGQLAGRRVEKALDTHRAILDETARSLFPGLFAAPTTEARRALFAEKLKDRERDLPAAAFGFRDAAGRSDATSPLVETLLLASTIPDGRRVRLAFHEKEVFYAVSERRPAGTLLLVLPFTERLRKRLEAEIGVRVQFSRAEDTTLDVDEKPNVKRRRRATNLRIVEDSRDGDGLEGAPASADKTAEATAAKGSTEAVDAGKRQESGGLTGARWVTWPMPLTAPLVDWTAAAAAEPSYLVSLSRTSIEAEARALFGEVRFGRQAEMELSRLAWRVLLVLAVITGAAYVGSSAIATVLVSRIARTTGRLSTAFREIEKGNFGYKARLRGRDQLAGLIEGFNRMSGHLSESVSERADKEALERELHLARDLQERLLPPRDFSFPGLEIAVDFRPAAAIGGDFYHFIEEGEGRLVAAIADVSGHGLATGIVMAAARAAFSALASTGVATGELFTTLDREIRGATDPRTFVTLLHARFLLSTGIAEFTNAGHLYPYRVEAGGRVTAIANPARPLGLSLPATFKTVTCEIAPGDLWVLMSDGIVEATSPADEEFGFARLEAVLKAAAGQTAVELRDRLLGEWRAFTGHDNPRDDRTLLVLRIL